MLDIQTIKVRTIFSILLLSLLMIAHSKQIKISRYVAVPIMTVCFFFIIQYIVMLKDEEKNKKVENDIQQGLSFKPGKKYDPIGGFPSGVNWL